MLYSLFFSVLLHFSCSKSAMTTPATTPTTNTNAGLSYLALGDSYTIGESVDASLRYPEQIKDSLVSNGVKVKSVRVIAKTGWTTDELQTAIDGAQIKDSTYDLVSLLIGVNNQYRGYPLDQYKKDFANLLTEAIKFANGNKGKVFIVSIPDYAYTPFGQQSGNAAQISVQIDQFNAAAKAIATQMGVLFVDITPISRDGLNYPELVANDGLHPSGKQYARWVHLAIDSIKKLVTQ